MDIIIQIKIIIKKLKKTFYKVLVKPVAVYICIVFGPRQNQMKKKLVFERKIILRKIFGPKRNNE